MLWLEGRDLLLIGKLMKSMLLPFLVGRLVRLALSVAHSHYRVSLRIIPLSVSRTRVVPGEGEN